MSAQWALETGCVVDDSACEASLPSGSFNERGPVPLNTTINFRHTACYQRSRISECASYLSTPTGGRLFRLQMRSPGESPSLTLDWIGTSPNPVYSRTGAQPGQGRRDCQWFFPRNEFFMFGGQAGPDIGYYNVTDEFWQKNSRVWNFLSGTNGTSLNTQTPGSRSDAYCWSDAQTQMGYMFGGRSHLPGQYYRDMWRFDARSRNVSWEFVGGDVMPSAETPGNSTYPGNTHAGSAAVGVIAGHTVFYMYGGWVSSSGADTVARLYRYNVSDNRWTLLYNGAQNEPVSYTVGSGRPGARTEAAAWTDSSGNLILHGGNTQQNQIGAYFSDLWRFQDGEWKLIRGPTTRGSSAKRGAFGQFSQNHWPSGGRLEFYFASFSRMFVSVGRGLWSLDMSFPQFTTPGTVTFPDSTAFQSTFINAGASIVVEGTATIESNSVLTLVLDELPSNGQELLIINATKLVGTFASINATFAGARPCEMVVASAASSPTETNSFSVVFSVTTCPVDPAVIGGIVAGAVVLLLLIVALPLGIRRYRMKVSMQRKLDGVKKASFD